MTGQHWTSRNEDAFAYAVASNFIAQLETKLDSENMDDKTLAMRAKVTPAYISQLFNSPGNIGVKTMAKLTRALNMKFAIVAYADDGDPNNDSGPIGPEVFRWAWEKCGRPRDLSSVAADKSPIPAELTLRTLQLVHSEKGAHTIFQFGDAINQTAPKLRVVSSLGVQLGFTAGKVEGQKQYA